jgi:RNA 2',3'-cyclic 3'-phosphodiesterase
VTAAARLRLFVALDLPGAVRDRLAGWATETAGGRPGIRPVPAPSLHVTLCFLGEIDVGEVEAIATACAVVGSTPPPRLTVTEPMWLPPRRPRVLAVGLDDHDGGVGGLQSVLAAALVAGGFYRPERRPFLPHVTVARVRRDAPRGVPRLGGVPSRATFTADRVSLYRSRPGPDGVRYEALAAMELSGPQAAA